jgi:glutamyl-tRNA reductase
VAHKPAFGLSGAVRPLHRLNALEGARILVIGAGGAARAAVFGLKERGSEVYILNRTAGPAKKLAHQICPDLPPRFALQRAPADIPSPRAIRVCTCSAACRWVLWLLATQNPRNDSLIA